MRNSPSVRPSVRAILSEIHWKYQVERVLMRRVWSMSETARDSWTVLVLNWLVGSVTGRLTHSLTAVPVNDWYTTFIHSLSRGAALIHSHLLFTVHATKSLLFYISLFLTYFQSVLSWQSFTAWHESTFAILYNCCNIRCIIILYGTLAHELR